MNDFLQVLSFSIFPILTSIIYATVIPPMGAILYLKNEIMLSIALPSFGFFWICGRRILYIDWGERKHNFSVRSGHFIYFCDAQFIIHCI